MTLDPYREIRTKKSSSQFAAIWLSENFSSQETALWKPLLFPQPAELQTHLLTGKGFPAESVNDSANILSITRENELTHSYGTEAISPCKGSACSTEVWSQVWWKEGFGNGLHNGQLYPLSAKERETDGPCCSSGELSKSQCAACNASLK